MAGVAATSLGALILWIILSPSRSAFDIGLGAAAILTAVIVSMRFDAGGGTPFHSVRAAMQTLAGAGAGVNAALRSAFAPRSATPGFVRICRFTDPQAQSEFAARLSLAPAALAVAVDESGVLAHAVDEARIDAAFVAQMERFGAASPGGAP